MELNSISLGHVKNARGNIVTMYAEFDDAGLFSKFIMSSESGTVDIDVWVVTEKGFSVEPIIQIASSRYDSIVSVNHKLLSNASLDMKSLIALKDFDIDLLEIKKINYKLQGKSLYQVISRRDDSLKVLSPPDRDVFDTHLEYRKAMDDYMLKTQFLRNRVAKELQKVDVIAVDSPAENTFISYNPKIAEYSFLNNLD